MIYINQKSDNLGVITSTLCLVHCIATPFIFIVQSCAVTCCESAPSWWRFIDYIFLAISFIAIYYSTQTTHIKWMKPALWISWSLLFLSILNQKTTWIPVNENIIYIPALLLILLHQYNKKQCKCNTTKCSTNEN